ncbi:1-acyl-sn-glycerol-3-phosphate acyltransferase [Parabacteroides sp. FAFU027]|uniref:1-acyl-sn-glycerol-3-phosphate acyltransferase n=1 Tax=Parabacteroides sp. FAFU027 TaxID=2922715 RepID=UPI001FAEFD7B|nr:1-acyl-sn-glycerol-3-phosphate acyltransferase [Parabacteroides sp. FAFU027]
MDSKIIQIDVDKVLREKAPKISKKLPRFVVSFLKKVIHQEGINAFLRKAGHLYGTDFADAMVDHWEVTLKVEGLENIPTDRKFVFASNHPLGGLDGIALISVIGKQFNGKVRFVVNDILMNIKNLEPVFVPVNKHGAQGKHSAEAINAVYNSDVQVLFFPAGLVSRRQHGKIEDLEWKKAFIAKSIQYQRDIVPVYFDGCNTSFFYNFALFRKKIGLKINLEMLLLPRELFKQHGKTFTIRFGEPVPWQSFDKTKSHTAWAHYVKEKAYALNK